MYLCYLLYYVLSELILVITFEIKDSFCHCSARKIKTTWQKDNIAYEFILM